MVLAMGLILKRIMTRAATILTLYHISSLAAASSLGATDTYCGRGECLAITVCRQCPDGTYMEDLKHKNINCTPCITYSADSDHVTDVEKCTRFRKTVIKSCSEGFEIFESKHDYECRPCQTVDCQPKRNTARAETLTASPVIDLTPQVEITDLATTNTPTTPTIFSSINNTINHTNCDDVMGYTEGGRCLFKEFVNQTCVFGKEPLAEHLPCQLCPQIAHRNVLTCQRVLASDSASLSDVAIAIIVCGTVAFIIMLFCTGFYWWRPDICRNYMNRVYRVINKNSAHQSTAAARVENRATQEAASPEEADSLV